MSLVTEESRAGRRSEKTRPSRIILASASPRRQAILAALGAEFDVRAADVDEVPRSHESPLALAHRLAEAKAALVAAQCPERVVLGADTVVAIGDLSLGKPTTRDEAISTLRSLRARDHEVITAVAAAITPDRSAQVSPEVWIRHASTRVWMRNYTDAEIASYVDSGDPFDKAGSYAIQHASFHPVARLDGCYLNVVGLPPREVIEVLRLAGAPAPRVDVNELLRLCQGCHEIDALMGHLGGLASPVT